MDRGTERQVLSVPVRHRQFSQTLGMDARVLVSHGIGGLQVKALAVVDINLKVAHSACLRLPRRGGASWRLRPWLAQAKVLDATAVVGRAVSLAETANRMVASAVDDWRSTPAFLLKFAPAAHGRCAGAVNCA